MDDFSDDTEFKFEPLWVIIYGTLGLCGLVSALGSIVVAIASFDLLMGIIFIIISIASGLVAFYSLPVVYKAIKGVPAMILTRNFVISNINNQKIDYNDITRVVVRQRGVGRDGKLHYILGIGLENPEKYFNTPVKRLIHKLRSPFTSDDIILNLNLISGDGEAIVQLINDKKFQQAMMKFSEASKTP